MAVLANTATFATSKTMREDLGAVAELIAPTDTPLLSSIGKGTASNVLHEWSCIDLAPATDSNQVAEGEADVPNDLASEGIRLSNYCQLSDKVASVSTSRQAGEEPGDLNKMAKQVALAVKSLRLDMEKHALSNKVANGSGVRVAASLPSFIRSNASRGSGGVNPALSSTTYGYPSTAAVDGTTRPLTETLFRDSLANIWTSGADATHVFAGAKSKQTISGFSANSTRFKEAEDRKLIAGIDIYESDFGQVRIIPSRYVRARDLVILDPTKVSVDYLQSMNQTQLARTGHADRRMVAVEYTLSVSNERALGGVFDLS